MSEAAVRQRASDTASGRAPQRTRTTAPVRRPRLRLHRRIPWTLWQGSRVRLVEISPSAVQRMIARTPGDSADTREVDAHVLLMTDGIIVTWQDRYLGRFNPFVAEHYAPQLAALQDSGRYGTAVACVTPATSLEPDVGHVLLEYAAKNIVPINQPPEHLRPLRRHSDGFDLVEQTPFAPVLQSLVVSRGGNPGWFALAWGRRSRSGAPHVVVHCPRASSSSLGPVVGAIAEHHAESAAALLDGGPVYLPGTIWSDSHHPLLVLGS